MLNHMCLRKWKWDFSKESHFFLKLDCVGSIIQSVGDKEVDDKGRSPSKVKQASRTTPSQSHGGQTVSITINSIKQRRIRRQHEAFKQSSDEEFATPLKR